MTREALEFITSESVGKVLAEQKVKELESKLAEYKNNSIKYTDLVQYFYISSINKDDNELPTVWMDDEKKDEFIKDVLMKGITDEKN